MSIKTIAIIGAGPAASTAAALFAQRGFRVFVFDDGKRPEMLVGESLIPAVIPLLRRLEIEDRVAAISQHKPGVSFLHGHAASIHFNFAPVEPYLPTYAYNVDRPLFDALLKTRATELGAIFVPYRAGVSRNPHHSSSELLLDPATLMMAADLARRQPDLIVDATGRARLSAKLLDIGADRGPRQDIALFSHFTDFAMPEPAGQVLISRLNHGWSWRIPLRDKLSVGIVIDKEAAKALGITPEERLAAALLREPLMAEAAKNARRIAPVAVYANYQLTSHRATGPGWAAIGDAFGFVDPMLSSGLFLAMESAAVLDDCLHRNNDHEKGCAIYEREMRRWYADWTRLIQYFYDGRIFSLHEAGHQMRLAHPNPLQCRIDRLTNKHIACMTAGALTRSAFSQWFLKTAARYLTWGVPPPASLAIH